MGTRNLTCVYKDGQFKVAQYGQWDGYPSVAGAYILKFLKDTDLSELSQKVDKCHFITDEELSQLWKECGADGSGFVSFDISRKFEEKYPFLHRDNGYNILDYIPCPLRNSLSFAGDGLFCEWAYVIDLDNNTFEVYEGFKSPSEAVGRFTEIDGLETSGNPSYGAVSLVKTYKLDDLPSKEDFLNDLEPNEEDE